MVERDYIDLESKLKNLMSNPDFKTVILEDYFINEVLEASESFNDAVTVNQGLRPFVLERLTGVNMLKYYFEKIQNLAASQKAEQEENIQEGDE